jgi:hypothetical protein
MNLRILAAALGLMALTAGTALWLARRENAELSERVARLHRQNADLRFAAKQAAEHAADAGRRAVELDSQLGAVKTRTTAAEARTHQLARELSVREQREVALMAELAELRQRATTPDPTEEPAILPTLILTSTPAAKPATHPGPAPTPPGPSIDIEPYRLRIAELEAQLIALLTRTLADLPAEPLPAAPVPPPTPFQVVRVGPADSFVVIDYGAEHGARPAALVWLRRGTSDMAQVQISDVRPRFSLARVLPGTLKGQLQPGDLVLFTP